MYGLMCPTYADEIRPIDSWNQGSQGLEPLDNDVNIEISGGAVRGIRLAVGGLHQQPENQRQAQQRSPGCRLTVPPLGLEGSGRSCRVPLGNIMIDGEAGEKRSVPSP